MTQMTDQAPAAIGIDATTPNVARIYDYLLGGKDNFAVDREAASRLVDAIPDAGAIARDNRSFLGRVVRYLATEGGVRQFLDLGCGLPTEANVHQLAQGVVPGVRVVYVDNDPMVASHGEALLASDQVAMVLGDLRQPTAILAHPEVSRLLDLSQPVAVLSTGTLHFIADEAEPGAILAAYRDRLASGSYLAISHAIQTDELAKERREAEAVYRQASSQLQVRPQADVLRFFDGFELIEPGLSWIAEWRQEPGTAPVGRLHSIRGGVGRKP
jgi:O-methyltransferase involved in polyketide biosynthesis